MSKSGRSGSASSILPLKEGGAPSSNAKQDFAKLEQELQEARKALQLSNGKLRMALDVGKLGAWERNVETGEIIGTATFKAILGLAPNATLNHEQLRQMFHPADVERVGQAVAYALKTKTDFYIEHRIIRADGQVGRVLVQGSAIFEDGRPLRLMGVLKDVTDQEKAREEINLAQRRQEFLLQLNDKIGSLDNPHRIMEIGTHSLVHFLQVDTVGYSEVHEDRGVMTIEKEWSKGLISNEGRTYRVEQYPADVLDVIRQGQPLVIQDVKTYPSFKDPDIRQFYTNHNIRSILSVPILRNDKLKAFFYVLTSAPRSWTGDEVILVEEVAERTWIAVEKARAERELRVTDARFRMIAESLPALVWIIDLKLELTYANDRWMAFSGLEPSKALGDSWMHWVHPDDLARVAEDMKVVLQNESYYSTEMRYRTIEGVYRWHMVQAAPVRDADGHLQGWAGTSVDIHDLKETEEALRTNEGQLRIALEIAKMGDWRWLASSKRIILSDRAAEILALPADSPITREELHEMTHPSDRARVLSTIQKAIEDHTQYNLEYRVRRAGEKSYTWIAAQGQTLYAPDGSFTGTTGVIQDITDRKHAEERQQLLIRELHHRVKNTLATVQAIVGSTARTATSIDDFYQGFVGRIVSLARTHNLLTEDLWQKADLKDLVQTELGPYEDESRNRVFIEGPSIELPSEAAVPVGMAIHELTTNAAKHGALSTFGGHVEVRWWTIPDAERPILHFTWTEQGGPRVSAPARQGFGSRLLQRVLTTQLQAEVTMDFREDGLHFSMIMPIPGDPPLFNPDK